MNRLWVRLSLMISSVLFLVFLLQFISISIEPERDEPPNAPIHESSAGEIRWRLLHFALFSIGVGMLGGVIIGRITSAPITRIATAAQRFGKGELAARVPIEGSQEMRELAEAFNKMADALQYTETLRNNLMADVSHELRTPLTVLEGNLRAALDRVVPLDDAEIANLYGQTRHLIRLVNDLRELTLAEAALLPLEKLPTDISTLITDTIQALEPLAIEKEVTITATINLPSSIMVDPFRIRQVVINLLSNALRHTPSGGQIHINSEVNGRMLIVAVHDTGEGLEPEQLQSVFERFYRGDKSRSRETGGTGLGLAIVKAIITAHGGSVEADSPGKHQGSTFRFQVPF